MADDLKRGKPDGNGSNRPAPKPPEVAAPQADGEEARRSRIAETAYYISERRGFAPGGEVEDWLAAEVELSKEPPAAPQGHPATPRGTS